MQNLARLPYSPNFILGGAQKSATTTLHHLLNQNDEIFIQQEENPFFEDIQQYNSYYNPSNIPECHRYIFGIKRPSYLGRVGVERLIQESFPKVKLIFVLRDPVSRAISAYFHYMAAGLVPVQHPDRGLRMIFQSDSEVLGAAEREIRDFGLYAQHLKRYLQYFSPSQILVVSNESVVIDTQNTLSQIFNFLDVSEMQSVPKMGASRKHQKTTRYELGLRLLSGLNYLDREIDHVNVRVFPKAGIPFQKFCNGARHLVTMSNIFIPNRYVWLPSLSTLDLINDFYEDDGSILENMYPNITASWTRNMCSE